MKTILCGVLVLLGGFGLWCLMLGGNPFHELALIRRGETTPGFIVDTFEESGVIDEGTDRGGTYWFHVVRYKYTLSDGREFTQTASGHGKLKDERRDLQQPYPIEVEYLPDDPSVSRIKGDGSPSIFDWVWRKAGLGSVLLAMFLAPGIVVLRDGIRQLRSAKKVTGALSQPQITCAMSDEVAVDIAVEFSEAYVIGNEEKWLFKPQSLLPRELEIVVRAMKVSYQTGCPFPDQLEQSYRFCFPQVSFFIPDDQFDRAKAYFERFFEELKKESRHRASVDYQIATVNLSAPGMAICTEPFPGHSRSGAELVAEMDEFFECEFLVHAPADPDKEWVQHLARNCWRNFRARDAEWAEFVARVKTGDSGLKPREVALST